MAMRLDYVEGQACMRHPARYLATVMKEDEAGQGFRPPEVIPNESIRARTRILEIFQAAVAARTPTQRDADRRTFHGRMTDANARDDFDRHGWMSPLNHAAIIGCWAEMGVAGRDG